MATTPKAVPAHFPAEYGQTEETVAELLAWDEVAERIAASPNYWLATTTDDGRPHLRPVDGVFVDMTLAFGGSEETRWVRHLEDRPAVSASLPDDDHAVILEGVVELVTDADAAISKAVAVAQLTKYPQYHDDGTDDFGPFWALHPRRVYAWALSTFPAGATRFDFDTIHPAGR
ncbi:MAG: pyridoxamine 5'-phosphate oxidase family protein [Acidimicrobiia bacterium]|nr:pyridoxamine 5'-phosphate oxidase family protein [Acidimicrobiia bacterium]